MSAPSGSGSSGQGGDISLEPSGSPTRHEEQFMTSSELMASENLTPHSPNIPSRSTDPPFPEVLPYNDQAEISTSFPQKGALISQNESFPGVDEPLGETKPVAKEKPLNTLTSLTPSSESNMWHQPITS